MTLPARLRPATGSDWPHVRQMLESNGLPVDDLSAARMPEFQIAEWPDGTVCTIFSAGVGTSSAVLVTQDVTLSCNPPC